MKVSGRITRWKARVFNYGLMDVSMMETLLMVERMVLECSLLAMENSMLVTLKMINSMARVNYLCKKDRCMKESGSKTR